MNLNLKRATFALAFIVFACGCGSGMSGKYVPVTGDAGTFTLDFQGGDKVLLTEMGMTTEGTYKTDGDKVTVYVNNKNAVFTKGSDGTLAGGPFGITLKKQD